MYYWHALYYVPVQFLLGSKRSFDWLSIKLNDLDGHMWLCWHFSEQLFCKISFKVLFSLRILPLMLGRGVRGTSPKKGSNRLEMTSYSNIQKRLNRRARIQENEPFAPYNSKPSPPLGYTSYGCATLRIGNSWLFLGSFSSLKWMLTRNTKCARLTETASVSFLTDGWIKWLKLSRKVDSQQRTPIEGKTKG